MPSYAKQTCKPLVQPQRAGTLKRRTYRMKDSWNLGSSFSPIGASMSNAARAEAMLRNRVRRANHLPGHILSSAQVAWRVLSTVCPETVEMERIVPSSSSEDPIFGILYRTIQLPVLQEPFRIVCVRHRVYSFIVAYRPIHSTQ